MAVKEIEIFDDQYSEVNVGNIEWNVETEVQLLYAMIGHKPVESVVVFEYSKQEFSLNLLNSSAKKDVIGLGPYISTASDYSRR
nr:unnamed protein product [Timema bartmani]